MTREFVCGTRAVTVLLPVPCFGRFVHVHSLKGRHRLLQQLNHDGIDWCKLLSLSRSY